VYRVKVRWGYLNSQYIDCLATIGKAYSMGVGHRHDLRLGAYRMKFNVNGMLKNKPPDTLIEELRLYPKAQ